MKIEFLEPAYIEYQEAIDFYNLQVPGLGDKFVIEIDRTISIIKKYPGSFTEYTKNTRKAILSVFPYGIIYSIHKNFILILAIAHQHRKPNYWVNREL